MALYYIPTDLITLPSALGGELLTFDATGASVIVAAGSDNDILSVVAGVPTFISGLAATQVSYDNTTSGLAAGDVQAAIDEVEGRLDTAETNITNLQNSLANLTFLDLTDTPANYTGQAYRALRVNSTEDGVEYSSTEALFVDSGTTAQRPGSPVNGMLRYNITNSEFEGYIAGSWQPLGTGGGGGGGSVVTSQTYIRTVDYDGTTDDTLPLPDTQTNEAYVFVFADGIWENSTSWSLINAGADIQFDAIIPDYIDEIEIRVFEVGTPTVFPVTSVFGRTGDVVAAASDYDAVQIDFDNVASGLTATNVQDAIDELDTAVDGLVAGFDIDALPAGTADDTADLMAISDQSDAGTEKKITLAALSSLIGGGGGATDFTDLNDTPGVYTGAGGDYVRVNVGETGLEFTTIPGAGGSSIKFVQAFFGSVPSGFTPTATASSAIIIVTGAGGGGSDGTGSATTGGNSSINNIPGDGGLPVVLAPGGGGANGTTGGSAGGSNTFSSPIQYSIFNLSGGQGQDGQTAFVPDAAAPLANLRSMPGVGGASFWGGGGGVATAPGAGGNGADGGPNADAGGGGGAGGTVWQVYEGSYQTYFSFAAYDIFIGAGGSGGGGGTGNNGAIYILEME
jgi:hypothetical protein